MTTLNFPTLLKKAPTSGMFSLSHNTQVFESPLNRTVQTLELPGARWQAEYEFANLLETDLRTIQAFLASLRGAAGRFYLWNMTNETPAGTAAGTPLVKGGSQTGTTLVTDGWTPDQAGLLLPGDHFGVNGELKIVTATAASSNAGESTITFEPPLRSSPADNAVVTITKPACVMRLVDDKQDRLKMIEARTGTFMLNAIEVLS